MAEGFDPFADVPRPSPLKPPPSTVVEKLCNPLAEQYLLSELLASNEWIEAAAERCRPADFSVPIHAQAYTRMIAESAAGRRVEAVTLDGLLRGDPDWAAFQMLSKLAAADLNATRDRDRTRSYADHITMLAKRRRLAAGLEQAARAASTLALPTPEVIRETEETLASVDEADASEDLASAGEFADRAIASFGQPVVGVRSGLLASLDEITGTLRHGDQLVMAGGTGMGKSATASSYALGAAQLGSGVLFVSQEMSGDQLIRRMLADAAHALGHPVPQRLIRDGFMDSSQLRSVYRARDHLNSLPIAFLDIGGLTTAKLVRRIRKQKRRFAAHDQRLDLVIIDYLQLMQPSRAGMSKYEAVSEVSTALKQIARDEGVVMITLAQLNRAYEKRLTKRPEKSDLRDSGQIEQDADCIVLLHREEVNTRTEEPVGKDRLSAEYIDWQAKMDAARGLIEFIVPKVRHGEPGTVLGLFHGEYQAVRGPVAGEGGR